MYSLTKCSKIKLTPAKAQEFLTFNTFEGQRALREIHVSQLAEKMVDKRFRIASVCLAYNGHNAPVLMNGQHTCHAVLESGVSVDAILEEYQCPTREDLGILFNQFEGNARTLADSVRAYANVTGCQFPSRISQVVVSAAIALSGPQFQRTATRDEKVRLLKANADFAHWLTALMSGEDGKLVKDYSFLLRAHIVRSMMMTYNACNEDDNTLFWSAVATGANLDKHSPVLKLRNFLMSIVIGLSNLGNYNSAKSTALPHEVIYRCIRAWNAWVTGEKLTIVKYSLHYNIPEVIVPTWSHKGKR